SSDVCSSDLAEAVEFAVCQPQLADDFGGSQVTDEALLAGGAEAAVETAAGLRGYAESSAPGLGDVDHFHAAATLHLDDPLVAAVSGGERLADAWRTDLGNLLEFVAQGLADIAHGVEVDHTLLVYPLLQLNRTEGLLSQALQESFQLRPAHPQQVGQRASHTRYQ